MERDENGRPVTGYCGKHRQGFLIDEGCHRCMSQRIDDEAEARMALLKWQRSMPGRSVEVRDGLVVIEGPGLPRTALATGNGLPVGAVFAAIGAGR